jgi:hypothetical protein
MRIQHENNWHNYPGRVRDLYSAAASRRAVQGDTKKRDVPGGLVSADNPRDQEAVQARQFHRLVHTLAKHDVPMIWLHFPRLVQDATYLYGKLKSVMPGPDWELFSQAFQAVSRPELVPVFKPENNLEVPSPKGLKRWFRKRPAPARRL